jgi:hypothetical protein
MSRRGRLGFVTACWCSADGRLDQLVDTLDRAVGQDDADSHAGSGRDPAGRPGRHGPWDVGRLQARFNDDQGRPRLVLALAPT